MISSNGVEPSIAKEICVATIWNGVGVSGSGRGFRSRFFVVARFVCVFAWSVFQGVIVRVR